MVCLQTKPRYRNNTYGSGNRTQIPQMHVPKD